MTMNFLPGLIKKASPEQQSQEDAMLLTMPKDTPMITEKDVERGAKILSDYKDGKANLEERIVQDQLWYQIRHWEALRRTTTDALNTETSVALTPEPSSAWVFNVITNKHADAMDNYPRPNVLPREKSDDESAKQLSSILPCVLEINDFEQTYSDNWYDKLISGTAPYFVGWDKDAENGLGEITIRDLDLLNIFWEPGISKIQKSRNLFITDLVDNDTIRDTYGLKDNDFGDAIDVKKYVYDDTVDTSGKSVVVDWYYKIRSPGGRTALHLIKFVGKHLLYASQNDPELRARGIYDHGLYPVEFDILFPEKGTPVGFGMVSVCRDPQLYIDKLSGHLLNHAGLASNPRYWAATSAGVNKAQFLDTKQAIVEVDGNVSEEKLRPIEVPNMDPYAIKMLQMKIDELKETSSNRDVNSGSTGSGVTAAAAIAALQEAGNKNSRDSISAAYRSYKRIGYFVVELIRQFYDETRTFRITGALPGQFEFVDFSNAEIKEQQIPPIGQDGGLEQEQAFRKPVFDIKISAEKKNPFSQMTQNEYAKEFYRIGFFNPEKAQETLIALDMMDFEGKDKIVEKVNQGQTLLNTCKELSQQLNQMAAIVQALTGKDMGIGQVMSGTAGQPASAAQQASGKTVSSAAANANKANMTSYMQQTARNAKPNMSASNNAVGMRGQI